MPLKTITTKRTIYLMREFGTLGGGRLSRKIHCLRSSEHAHITKNNGFTSGKSAATQCSKICPIAATDAKVISKLAAKGNAEDVLHFNAR